jgi:NTP pyrophosphatase (non-canonical NTP hydrolase)
VNNDLLLDKIFVETFVALQQDAAQTNQKNGFTVEDALGDDFEIFLNTHSEDRFRPLLASFRNARLGLKLALITGELSETLEAVRKNIGPDSHCPEFDAETVELADAVIRIMNLATDRKKPLAEAIVAKNRYNRNRLDHSKESRAAEHGKKF